MKYRSGNILGYGLDGGNGILWRAAGETKDDVGDFAVSLSLYRLTGSTGICLSDRCSDASGKRMA